MNKTIIYTDGSCLLHHPSRPGGWASIIIDETNKHIILSGSANNTTNNRMELVAVLEAIKYIINNKQKTEGITIYSDSSLICNIGNSWIFKWVKNNWKLSTKKNRLEEIKNKDLVIELYSYLQKYKIDFILVKGHSDNQLNNLADKYATHESASLASRL